MSRRRHGGSDRKKQREFAQKMRHLEQDRAARERRERRMEQRLREAMD